MLLSNFGSRTNNKVPPTKPDSVIICETLMNELESQMKEMERLRTEKDSEEKKRKNEADYSWLVSDPRKNAYRLSPVDRLVLEELFSQVRPGDCGNIITQFRTIVETNTLESSEIPTIFRCVIERYLSESSGSTKDDTTLKWVTRSLTDLGSSIRTLRSQSSSKVYPVASTSTVDVDNQRSHSMPEFVSMKNFPV